MEKKAVSQNESSQNLFIINNKFFFIPDQKKLAVLGTDGVSHEITINAPASRCLLLLISNPQSIISRETFLEKVWKKNGVVVSQNTYYQNISILRKAFKKIGLSEDAIVTVPHKGLTMKKSLSIKKANGSELKFLTVKEKELSGTETLFAQPALADRDLKVGELKKKDMARPQIHNPHSFSSL